MPKKSNGEKPKLFDLLRFDADADEFELLEVEHGDPGYFGSFPAGPEKGPQQPPLPSSAILAENEQRLKKEFRADINTDVLFRHFSLGGVVDALCVCINGMASSVQVHDFILKQGMRPGCMDHATTPVGAYAITHIFAQQEAILTSDWKDIKEAILQGRTAVFIDSEPQAILMDTRGFETRGVNTAQNEKVVRGPQEGFNENLRTNITLLRRIIKTEDFICEFRDSGGKNNVSLVLAYRADVVNPTLLREVRQRLDAIDTRMLLNDGTIEQMIEPHSLSPLPQSLSTERPDRVAAHIMQGHIALLLEGSPTTNVLPATLFTLMSTSEDSYLRRPLGGLLRAIRYIGAALSILLPGYFLAVAMHHPGMLSTETIATIIASRQMVFLPLGLEMLFLLWVFQLLREAGVRVPGSVGQSIGIIGGLILGQAAVAANMVSTIVLILVALVGLGNFTIPDYSTQIAAGYFRVFLVLLGWAGGLLGLSAGILALAVWLCSLKSYGVPFLAPIAPKTNKDRPNILRGQVTRRQRATDYTNTQEEAQ